jgi:hypothetical protein
VRRPCCSRLAFQIWPHAVHRQYVETLTVLLVVVTSRELQNGHASGATVGSVDWGWVYTWRPLSALWIVSLAEPLFGYPLIADVPEVEMIPLTRRGHQQDNDHRDDDREHDPASGHG